MTRRNIFVAIGTSLLCGWLSVAVAAEPEAAPAAAAPAAHAAAQAAAPAASATDSPATAVQNAAAARTEAVSAGTPTAAATQPATSGDDEIVCKKQEVFGSRVRKTKICRTKREWQMESQAAKDYTKGINKGSSPGPGGEALPVGG
jgi:hypothetical protein